MGLLRSAARAAITGTSGVATPEKWVADWVTGGIETPSGVQVSESTALHYSPFWAGVRVISEDVASMPLLMYERLERGKRRATDHPLYQLLHDAPNPMMTAVQLRETLMGHVLTWGNGVAYVVSDSRGQIRELWPLRPDRITFRSRRTGPGRFERFYDYADERLNISARLKAEDVLHVSGLGFDGICGYPLVWMARNSIGLGLATETYGGKFFGNGSRPGGVLQHPGQLTDVARKRLQTDWENMHKGLDKAQRVAILEEGVTWQQVGVPNDDAQFLESRRMQVTEMARWLRLPAHKIQDLERSTFANIESQQLDYVTSALRIWLVRWEQAITLQLLTAEERSRYFAEHLVDGLLRGDTPTRFQAYATARQWGWMSANDVREKENENPVDGGDTYLVPLNMVPATDVGAGQSPGPPRALPQDAAVRGRGAQARRRIADAFVPMIRDADERMVKLERAEVRKLVERHLQRAHGRGLTAFLAGLDDLYEGLVTDRSVKAFAPVLTSLAGEVAADAAADVGGEAPDLDAFMSSYVASHVDYRVGSASGWLRRTAEQADDPVTAVRDLLDQWTEDRPDQTARWEKNQVANAAARETWRSTGVRQLRWVTVGRDCPFCDAMDGRTVGIDEPFAAGGDKMTGLEQVLQIDRNTHHPPLHPGCDCEILPG